MKERNHQRFTIRELAANAARELSSADVDQSSGRVSDVPSSRTIRYYASHGLLDSPDDWEGRTAIYGRRHLMQLVAIKRLQARGATLSQIQERLHGLPEENLADLARMSLSNESDPVEPEIDSEVSDVRKGRRGEDTAKRSGGSFWEERGSKRSDAASATPKKDDEVGAMRLDDDVLLVIEGLNRTLDEDDRHALRVAAEPLLHLLKARRIIGKGTENGGQK